YTPTNTTHALLFLYRDGESKYEALFCRHHRSTDLHWHVCDIQGCFQPRNEHLHLHLLSPSSWLPHLAACSSSTKEKCTTGHDTWGAHKALLLCLNRDYAWGKSVPCKPQVHLCNGGICSRQLTPSHHLLLGSAFEDGVCEAEELFRHSQGH
ncbi:Os12g0518200, partial [Oryza sativa Japonica Group]